MTRASRSRGRGVSHQNENIQARDQYRRVTPNEFGHIVLSGDSDIETGNGDMSQNREKEIITPFQNKTAVPLSISTSSAPRLIMSLLNKSNKNKRMHWVNKKYRYSEYWNNMYDLNKEDPLEDKAHPL